MGKKYVKQVVCVCFIASIVMACKSSVSSEKVINQMTGQPVNEERTLTFYHWDTKHQDLYQTLATNYMQNKEGLSIEIQAVPEHDYLATWMQAVSDHQIPDVFAVPAGDEFKPFAESKQLAELTKLELVPEFYDQRLLQFATIDKKVWSIPINLNVPVILYRQSYYDDYGLQLPLTSADFFLNCDILKENNVVPFAFAIDGDGYFETLDFAEGIMANGYHSDFVIQDAVFDPKSDTMPLELYDLGGVAYQMYMVDYFPPKDQAPDGHDTLLEQFAQGDYAMISGELGDLSTLLELNKDGDYAAFMMPGTGVTYTGVLKAEMMLSISKDSKVAQDAADFIEYLLSKEAQQLLCDETFTIPVVSNVPLKKESLNQIQRQLNTVDGNFISFFQRLSKTERQLCLEKIDQLFTNQFDSLHLFMMEWKEEL